MKKVFLSLSCFALLSFAAGLLFTANSRHRMPSKNSDARESLNLPASATVRESGIETDAGRPGLEARATGDADLPLGARRLLEKLRRTVPAMAAKVPPVRRLSGNSCAALTLQKTFPSTRLKPLARAHASQLATTFADTRSLGGRNLEVARPQQRALSAH